MQYKEIISEKLGEKLYLYEHSSGLKAYILPKKGFSKKYATFGTHYGSINNQFIIPGTAEITKVPDGIAHFLEHKLFEQKDGNVMDKFAEIGGNSNAYTSFNQTVYLFSCTDMFDECFKLLVDYVQNPYITEESVEKEKGIIGQEIRMYEDDPGWRVFFNLLGGLYKNHPVKIDIAGTIESISGIDRDVLYKCYSTFYHPSNMVIFAAGDVDVEKTFEIVERGIQAKENPGEIKRIFPDESDEVNKDYVEQKLAVSIPMFQIGFKDVRKNLNAEEAAKRSTAMKILLEMLMGRSSELYTGLYEKGLIDTSFSSDYTLEEDYGYSAFGGESKDPAAVREIIIENIRRTQSSGIREDSFDRIRKAMYGKFVKQFNYMDRISNVFISGYFKGISPFDYVKVFEDMSFDYINSVFAEHFDIGRMVMSVVKPA